jgi:mannose-1-phosphate guanylyltransferase
MKNTYALIMAGGVGSRFWPKSRKSLPKQYINLLGTETMIQTVAHRIRKLISEERIHIVTTEEQHALIEAQLPWFPSQNIIFEPFGKNTAPCIGLAAIHIVRREPNAVMIVLPADHLIVDSKKFLDILQRAVALIRKHPHALATVGIVPHYAATGYGYIQRGEKLENSIYRITAFTEKPELQDAESFYQSGQYYWNSGVFIWRADTILESIAEFMPELSDGLTEIRNSLDSDERSAVVRAVYQNLRPQSIDYGVMEKASDAFVLEGDFGWSDVGSWEEVYKISSKDQNGNVINGRPILKDVKNTLIETGQRAVAVIGVDNLIVVDTPDALLICNRDNSQDVKWVVEKLKRDNLEKHL